MIAKACRKQNLQDKFEKLHNDGAEEYGFAWLGLNRELLEIVSTEFPEIETHELLMKTLLSRVVYWAIEKVRDKNTPEEIEIVAIPDKKKKVK